MKASGDAGAHADGANLATERLAAAGMEQQRFLEGELSAARTLHEASAELEALR